MPLHVRSQKDQGQNYLIELKGSIDSDTSARLQEELKKVETAGAQSISLNCGGVDYISSMGMGILVNGMKTFKERQASFLLFGLQPQVRKVFDIMRLTSIFEVLDSLEEAERYVQEHRRIPS